MNKILEELQLPGSKAYTLVLGRKDVEEADKIYQAELNLDFGLDT